MNTSYLSSNYYTTSKSNEYYSPTYPEKFSSSNLRYSSPSKSRIDDNTYTNSYIEKRDETSDLETKVRVIDARVTVDKNLTDEKFKAYVDQVERIEGQLYSNGYSAKAIQEKLTEEMRQIKTMIHVETGIQDETNKEFHKKVLVGFEGQIANFKHDVATSLRNMRENMKTKKEDIERKFELLQGEVEIEMKERKEEEDKLIKRVSSKIGKVKETLDKERKARRETDDVLLNTLEDMNRKLATQVKAENENREKGEDQMLKLLDLTFAQLEGKMGSSKAGSLSRLNSSSFQRTKDLVIFKDLT